MLDFSSLMFNTTLGYSNKSFKGNAKCWKLTIKRHKIFKCLYY
jgi:hypothetical protein